jgi:amidase
MRDDPYRALVPYPEVAVAMASTGPLADLRFAVKDLFDVAGYPTGGGSPLMLAMSGVKTATAPLVQSLLDAGARFVGKTHTDELAFSLNGKNAHFGTPINPAAPERVPGGSSSGSAAAVAGRLVDFALGSDTGGSVRAPASYCGLFGIRPSYGRLSLERCQPLAPSFDVPGWFARDARVFQRVGDVMLRDDKAPLPGAARLLVARDAFALADAEAGRLLTAALRRVALRFGSLDEIKQAAPGVDDLYWAFRHLQGREAWDAHGAFIERHKPPLGPGVAERFAFGKEVTDHLVAEAKNVRCRFRTHLAGLLGDATVLVLPTVPDIAPLLSLTETALEEFRNRALRLLCLAGLSGFPQVTIPVAEKEGAPLGLSLIGPSGSDRSLVALAVRVADAALTRLA